MSRILAAVVVALTLAVPMTVPAAEDPVTTLALDDPTVSQSTISVAGTATYGSDATDEVVLGSDPEGDAEVAGVGLDLNEISVRPDLPSNGLVWRLTTHDGIADPMGNPPATGYMVPIMVDGDDRWRWLAAGNSGTGWLPQPTTWTGLCHNEEESGQQGGYLCPTMLPGSVAASGVTWTQPFTHMKPQVRHGSVIESSSIFCGRPCSFPWFVVARPHNAVDQIDSMAAYKVPGEVMLAIVPSGLEPSDEDFTRKAAWDPSTSRFSGLVSRPQESGSYTVWARTCFGIVEAPTCVEASTDVTV